LWSKIKRTLKINCMPESKTRHPHKHPDHHHPKTTETLHKHKKTSRTIIATVLFCGLLGLAVSFFMAADSVTTLVAGTLLGCIAGYIFGYQVDKSLSKK
jgi:ABC-type dipeptide/oligopeptide/nickel transport system permease subunit